MAKKKMYLTSKEYWNLVEDVNKLIVKIGKKKEAISDSYSRDYLEAAKRALSVVKYNITSVNHAS
ncbi:MAG: hypothetical protein IKM77_12050 [Prevotella sp.]|nr:hypothetical protein [Prevotella sp.]